MSGTILLASDNREVIDEVSWSFDPGTSVVVVADSREALAHMADEVPAAVVVDLQTGSAGGFDLSRDMKFDARLAQVPVIVLLDRPQDAWLAEQAGAAAHLVKPVEGARLARLLAENASG